MPASVSRRRVSDDTRALLRWSDQLRQEYAAHLEFMMDWRRQRRKPVAVTIRGRRMLKIELRPEYERNEKRRA